MKDAEARERIDALDKKVEKLSDMLNYPYTYESKLYREMKTRQDVIVSLSDRVDARLQALLDYLSLEIVPMGSLTVKVKESKHGKSN